MGLCYNASDAVAMASTSSSCGSTSSFDKARAYRRVLLAVLQLRRKVKAWRCEFEIGTSCATKRRNSSNDSAFYLLALQRGRLVSCYKMKDASYTNNCPVLEGT